MRGVVSAESPSALAGRGAQGAGRRRAHLRDHHARRRRRASTSTPTPARRSTTASPPRRRAPTRPSPPPRGQVVTYGGQPGHHVLLLDLGRRDRERRELVRRRAAQAVAEGRRRPLRRRLAQAPLGPVPLHRPQVAAQAAPATCTGASAASRSLQRGVVAARRARAGRRHAAAHATSPARSCAGLRPLRHVGLLHLGELEGRATPKPKKQPAQPAPPGDPTGGVVADRAARPRRSAHASTGTIAPAQAGRWLRVERRVGTRWVAAADAHVLRGGRYSVAVPGPGVYRVVYGQAPARRCGSPSRLCRAAPAARRRRPASRRPRARRSA